MPTTTVQQERWHEVVTDPTLRDCPHKVETNERGQLILTPHSNRHSDLQTRLFLPLREHAPKGHVAVEYALATPEGVKVPGVVWMSPDRRAEMRDTGDPSTLAPELCVEIMSRSNTEDELREKWALYREIGAEEVWIVDADGRIRVFGEAEREGSEIAPSCPNRVDPTA